MTDERKPGPPTSGECGDYRCLSASPDSDGEGCVVEWDGKRWGVFSTWEASTCGFRDGSFDDCLRSLGLGEAEGEEG